MRHIIIGDVHGCIIELDELLDRCCLTMEDRLYFIGDLIDRGPDSVAVVRRVQCLTRYHTVTLILGNHEEKFLRYIYNLKNDPSAAKQMKGTEHYAELVSELTEEEIRFLKGSFYATHIESSRRILLIHGGIPATSTIDLGISHAYRERHTAKPKGIELITMTRYLDEKGNFLSLNKETEDSPFWAQVYDGRWGYAIFGHHAIVNEHPRKFENGLGIDTGCVFGGWLTAVVNDGVTDHLECISVKAKDTYSRYYPGK